MDTIDYAEVFGLDAAELAAAETGEQVTEPADPSETGENEQPPAEAEQQVEEPEPEDGDEPEEDAEEQTNTEQTGPKEQTREERAKNAAARRKAELDAAVAAAVERVRAEEQQKAKDREAEFFRQAGLKDPTNGNKPIATMEDFQAYRRAYEAQQLSKSLQAGTLTPEQLQQVIEQTPIMQQIKAAQEEAERQKQQAERERQQAQIDAEIAQIGKLDPSIKSVEDLLKMDTAQDFYRLVKAGNSFYDAYRLANWDKITRKQTAAAQRQAQTQAASKSHLRATATRGAAPAEVPKDELEMFKMLNPDATREEINDYYNKYLKQDRRNE